MDHEATMRRLHDLINAHDVDGIDDVMAADFVEHEELPGLAPGREGLKQFFAKAVARVSATGTHHGEFMGVSPTGTRIEVQLIDIVRFGDDGLAQEHWGVADVMAMMQQLGAVPEGPG